MSRKDFIAFAAAIAEISDKDERKRIAELIGCVCAYSNSNFDYCRWYRACNVQRN